MSQKLIIITAAMIGWSVFGGVAHAAFVLNNTLRPQDTEPSVRTIMQNISEGAVTLDQIEGIHHPRTRGAASGQANTATIYARVSGEVPSLFPGRPPVQLDREILTFLCDQLEDRRWICSTVFLTSLFNRGEGAVFSEFFFLER